MKTLRSLTRGRLIALAATALVLLSLVAVGVYGLLAGQRPDTPNSGDPSPVGPSPLRETTVPGTPPIHGPRLTPIPASADPDRFARNAADALFAWDTTTGLGPLDYASVLLDVGDPSGTEQAGLAADIATYLPSREAWAELRKNATTQHLTITSSFIPASWGQALGQARPGQIAPGTVAVTIEGTRHRMGVWNNRSVTTTHDVAFTVFVVCKPSYPSCRLLRLSQLDNPLR